MEPKFFVDNVNLSEKNASMTFFNFSNKIMAYVYKLIFNNTLPRMLEEMKICMQNANEPVGDWFLYKEHTMLRIYGFTEEPYKLLAFLTKRIFVLEFLRQK